METPKEQRPAGFSRTTCSALVRRCNVCNVINAVDLDATPERWAEMQLKDHTVWHVDEVTAIKLWGEEGGKCDHAKLIAELHAKLSPQNDQAYATGTKLPKSDEPDVVDVASHALFGRLLFVYALNGVVKCFSADEIRPLESVMLDTGWKHTATIDPARWIEAMANGNTDPSDMLDELQFCPPNAIAHTPATNEL